MKKLKKNASVIYFSATVTAAVLMSVLKIFGLLSISWLWALAPVWVNVAVYLVVTIVILIVLNRYERNRKKSA